MFWRAPAPYAEVDSQSLSHFGKNLLNFNLQHGQVINSREPNLLNVYSEVIVNEFVTHSGDVFPGNVGITAT